MREKVCKKCLVEHNEEIHEATESLHAWLRERVLLSIAGIEQPEVPHAA